MNLPLEEARRSAVTGAHNLIALARACEHKNVLQKVEFVSTVGVGGRLPGLLPERWIHEPRGFHNTYEQSKAEAEEIVAGHIEAGLPATVHRPSMVVGDSRTGKIMHFQIFYHLAEFLSGRRTCGLFPSLGQAKLDLVPVDYVARAIVWSSKHADTVGKVFHLCAGPRGALPLHVLRDRIRSRFASAGVRTPRTCTVPGGLFRTLIRVVGAMTTEGNRRALRTLPIFLDYLAEEQLFENADSIRVLATAGIELRPIDEVIDCVLGYYLAHRLVSG
jgi:nucleoside-diphosphate-sugar epimerase